LTPNRTLRVLDRSALVAPRPAAEARRVQRIVVGVDGSAESRSALRWAADVAGGLGAALEVVRVWQYPPALREWDAVPSNYGYLPMVPGMERGVRDDLPATVAEVLGPQPKVVVMQRVVEGHPAQLLIDAADGAMLLVVGRRGHGGLVGLLLGSVARACTEHAGCPVVVVPRPRGLDGDVEELAATARGRQE
jgi:nucleotide-binding universal stress UspA family protein